MPSDDTARTTQLLVESTSGDTRAVESLFPLIYEQLRSLAHSFFHSSHSPQVMDPTELVHETYVKLIKSDSVGALERTHFFRLAARAMRQVLCDQATARRTAKRGGNWARVDLTVAEPAASEQRIDALDLHESLESLRVLDERKADVVTLRFLAGLSTAETAHALGVSVRTVELDWRFARAWLRKTLTSENKS